MVFRWMSSTKRIDISNHQPGKKRECDIQPEMATAFGVCTCISPSQGMDCGKTDGMSLPWLCHVLLANLFHSILWNKLPWILPQ